MTSIEWTEQTWNPIIGCSLVSPGCTNCYAMKMAARIEAIDEAAYWTRVRSALVGVEDADAENRIRAEINNARVRSHYAGTTEKSKAGAVWTGKVALAPDHILTAPLRWKKPRMVFVNSMGDLFHEDVPDEWIDRVFAVMALSPQHTFQVLTKRSARMRDYFDLNDDGDDRLVKVAQAAGRMMEDGDTALDVTKTGPWPLPHVWLGVSCERQTEADARIPDLLATPAATRFVSAEPLLSEIDFQVPHKTLPSGIRINLNTLTGEAGNGETTARLDWVIVGGESGPGARPMHPDWARSIRDQCQAADVPYFFKQWGEYIPGRLDGDEFLADEECVGPNPTWGADRGVVIRRDGIDYRRVGKSRAGRHLDGREWNEMPLTLTLV